MGINWRREYETKGGVDGQWDFIRQDGINLRVVREQHAVRARVVAG